MVLLLSTSVLGSCCSPGNVPFCTSPELVWPRWVGFCLPHAGAGVSASSPPSGWIIVHEGTPGLRFAREERHISTVLFPFQSLILHGKACGTSGCRWVGGEAEQAVRERSVTPNPGEFGPIPHFLACVNSGSCASKHICVTAHNEPVVYVQRHPRCFPAGAYL